MCKNFTMKVAVLLTIFGTFLFAIQPALWAQPGQKGSLAGYIYQSDGTTPAQGAVIKLRNLATGSVFESTKSTDLGYFKVDSLDQGLYVFGAVTDQGEFNATDVIGIEANATAKLSVALKTQADVEQTGSSDEPPAIRGEKFLGRIVEFNSSTLEARVFVEKGECNLGDTIHVWGEKKRGSETNFYQRANTIKQNGYTQKKALAGQYYHFPLEKPALVNDWVYLKERSGLAAFFLTPIGMATVLAGSTGIVYIVVTTPPPVSVHKQ
jgi:hypothetical protein